MGEWCEVRRAEARARMAKVEPWEKSTGATSTEGKRKIRLNVFPPEEREFRGQLIDAKKAIDELDEMY